MRLTQVRLAELTAALSLATDLGMGQPLEFALQATVLAVRLGEKLGLGTPELANVYYHALLRYIGCNADTYILAAAAGDELAVRTGLIHVDRTSPDFLRHFLRTIRQTHAGEQPIRLVQAMAGGLLRMGRAEHEFYAGHCEVAHRLAVRLGLSPQLAAALRQVYARWDGKGVPALTDEAIAPSQLIVSLAQDGLFFYRLEGPEAATAMARKRSGSMYDPRHVERLCQDAAELFRDLEQHARLEAVLALEPGKARTLAGPALEGALTAVADYVDIKSPWLLGHSRGVAALAAEAGKHAGLPADDAAQLRQAGWLHDLGRVGVSAGVWGKPGPLTAREWEAVRLHAYHSERVLAQSPALAGLAALVGRHHERLDGTGYHRGERGPQLTPAARLLAAADAYQALGEARPHRPARPAEEAAAELKREVRAGRLDPEAVEHVLAAAGQRVPARRALVAGLSEREVQVLRLVARGLTIRQIAAQLVIAPKTVDNHLQRLYAKTGVTTRAGATLFAMENGLLEPN